MAKVLKIVVMLLVVAAVVFAAGCSGNTKTTSNVTQGASEQETPKTSVASEGGNESEASANVPADANVTENNVTAGNDTNISKATVSEPQGNTTGRVSLTQMKRDKIRQNLGVNGGSNSPEPLENNTSVTPLPV